MSLISELKRRNVVRAVLAYVVAGYLLVEIMELATGAFEAPTWILKVFITVIILGVVPVVVFSWVYEITPEGIKREATDRPEHSDSAARKLDIAVLVMLTVAIGLFVQERFGSEEKELSPPVEITEQTRAPADYRGGPPMVAVLPFESASLEGESEFFASGVHDDLLTQLAQLESIRVISRTSVLEYRDTVRNIREIGEALGADAILEGGVRSAGDQIRINAQLIDARTDEHLWAQTYDRELSLANIFEVQMEIARAITSALQATLTAQDAKRLTVIPTENMAAYRAYHRAMENRDSAGDEWKALFRQALEEAVALDPTFIRAWAELGGYFSYASAGNLELIQPAEQILERIRTLAPKSADYLIAQAYYSYYILKNYDRAHQLITQAQDMVPSDARISQLKSWIQRRQGDFEGEIESIRIARRLDPRNPQWARVLTRALMISRRYGDAGLEIENSRFEDYEVSFWREILRLREHRDLARWVGALAALQKEFEGVADPHDMWEAHIAVRDYGAAEKLLSAQRESSEPVLRSSTLPYNYLSFAGISMKSWDQIVTSWFMQRSDRLAVLLSEARTNLEKSRKSGGDRLYRSDLGLALVAAAEGKNDEAEQLIRRWRRGAATDMADLIFYRHYSCRVLGMARATAAAVECIRVSLAEPSFVMPFMEPSLPYYDSIRDEPAFTDLLADLDDEANHP